MQKTSETVLPNLRNILENPPSLSVSVNSEVLGAVNVQASLNESNHGFGEGDITADSIDWDITMDSSQIDWDIGTVEETEDTGNGLGPYEIVNASEILQSTSLNDAVESDHTLLNKEDNVLQEFSVSETSWDISVENPQVDVPEGADFSNAVPEPHISISDISTEIQDATRERSQLLETDFRNKIIDDLFEVSMITCPLDL